MTSKLFAKFSCPIISTLMKTVHYNDRMLEQNTSLKVTEFKPLFFWWRYEGLDIACDLLEATELVNGRDGTWTKIYWAGGSAVLTTPQMLCLLWSVLPRQILQHKYSKYYWLWLTLCGYLSIWWLNIKQQRCLNYTLLQEKWNDSMPKPNPQL